MRPGDLRAILRARLRTDPAHAKLSVRSRIAALSIGTLLVLSLAACKSGGQVSGSPTATPLRATATVALSGMMVLGTGMRRDTQNKLVIVGETNTFDAGSPFTYLVTVQPDLGASTVTLQLSQLNQTGRSTSLSTWPVHIGDPTQTEVSQSWSDVSTLMLPCAGTRFELDLYDGGNDIAYTTFTFTGCGLAPTG